MRDRVGRPGLLAVGSASVGCTLHAVRMCHAVEVTTPRDLLGGRGNEKSQTATTATSPTPSASSAASAASRSGLRAAVGRLTPR